MKQQLLLPTFAPVLKATKAWQPQEFKLISLRECPNPDDDPCDRPEQVLAYWRHNVERDRHFSPDRECMVVFLLNTRRRLKGHVLLSIGTLDTLLVRAADVFRPAAIDAAHAIIIAHNHPSGDPTPSEQDIKVTRDLIRAGQILKIELLDHLVIGQPTASRPCGYCSLRELGYWAGF